MAVAVVIHILFRRAYGSKPKENYRKRYFIYTCHNLINIDKAATMKTLNHDLLQPLANYQTNHIALMD